MGDFGNVQVIHPLGAFAARSEGRPQAPDAADARAPGSLQCGTRGQLAGADTSYQDIDYAVYICGNGHAYALEGPAQKWLGAYAAGDVFRVEIQGGNLRYKKNGVTMYEHAATLTYPLLLDTSLYTPGVAISAAKLSGALE